MFFWFSKFLAKRTIPEIVIEPPPATHTANPHLAICQLAQALNQILQANQIASTTYDNQSTIYDDATEMFEQLMQQIERAQTSIHLQTYIFQLDHTGFHSQCPLQKSRTRH